RAARAHCLFTELTQTRHTFRRNVGDVLDLLLPQRCLVCSLPGGQVCAACTGHCVVSGCPRVHVAARRPLGRCGAAPSVWGGGSRSRAPARRSSTTRPCGESSEPGRSEGSGGSPPGPRLWSSTRSSRRPATC